MLYNITKEQLVLINHSLDVALKFVGLQGGHNVMGLANHFASAGPEGGQVDFNEEQVAQISDVLDITLRQTGLQSLNAVVQLVALFNNPITEVIEKEAAAKEDVAVEDEQVTD